MPHRVWNQETFIYYVNTWRGPSIEIESQLKVNLIIRLIFFGDVLRMDLKIDRPKLKIISSEDLFGDGKQVLIEHGSSTYRLIITRQGKLILNKWKFYCTRFLFIFQLPFMRWNWGCCFFGWNGAMTFIGVLLCFHLDSVIGWCWLWF